MATEIEKDATDVLRLLVRWEESADDDQRGNYYVHGPELGTKEGLTPQRVNLAVAFLERSGLIESHGGIGTAPFDFQMVRPTVDGHLEAQRSEANGQPTEMERDATTVLRTLAGWAEAGDDPHRGEYGVSGKELTDKLGLPPRRVNNAFALLQRSGFVSWSGAMGTAPYEFVDAMASPEGHLEVQRLTEQETQHRETRLDVFLGHSSLDDNLCKDITVLLENSDLRVFATPASIPTGKWEEQIEEALQNASTVWVLLTPNAMSQSVWTHHEFGYFYGFRHGKGVDPRGDSCRFLYSDPSHLRGLYSHIQGIQVASFEDPVVLARIIAKSLQKAFKEPANPGELKLTSSGWTAIPPEGLDELEITGTSSSAAPDYSYGISTIDVYAPQAIFNVSAVTWHPQVYVSPLKQVPQIGSRQRQQVSVRVVWGTGGEPPQELQDSYQRRFSLQRPRDPGPRWAPLYITFETQSGQPWAAVAYLRVERQQHGHPETQLLYGPNPFGWVKGRSA